MKHVALNSFKASITALIAGPTTSSWRIPQIRDQLWSASIFSLVPLGLWIFLCRDWPLRLGFYSDDWMIFLHPFPGTLRAFRDILSVVITRPASAPYIWLAQVLVDWSPAQSQYLNITMLLATAVSVGALAATIASIAGASRSSAVVGACFAVAAFAVFPSNLGAFAWGTGVVAVVPATPLFCLGMVLLLRSEDRRWRASFGLLLLLLSHLSYEAFYFQEVIVVLATKALANKKMNPAAWRLIGLLIVINVACLLFNRLVPNGIHKTFHWNVLPIFLRRYWKIIPILGHAAREYVGLVGVAFVCTTLSAIACLSRTVGFKCAKRFILFLTVGGAAAGLLFAAAGYGFEAEGPGARSGIVVASYFSIAFGVEAAAAWSVMDRHRLLAYFFFIFACLLLAGTALSARFRVGEWAETWAFELDRLSRLPGNVVFNDGKTRAFLAIENRPEAAVDAASSPWEIHGAVVWAAFMRSANGDRRIIRSYWDHPLTNSWFSTTPYSFNRWNGVRFEQGLCADFMVSYYYDASEFWIWDTTSSELKRVEALWQKSCN